MGTLDSNGLNDGSSVFFFINDIYEKTLIKSSNLINRTFKQKEDFQDTQGIYKVYYVPYKL